MVTAVRTPHHQSRSSQERPQGGPIAATHSRCLRCDITQTVVSSYHSLIALASILLSHSTRLSPPIMDSNPSCIDQGDDLEGVDDLLSGSLDVEMDLSTLGALKETAQKKVTSLHSYSLLH